jgi:hypothetical protein
MGTWLRTQFVIRFLVQPALETWVQISEPIAQNLKMHPAKHF